MVAHRCDPEMNALIYFSVFEVQVSQFGEKTSLSCSFFT